ncbi:MAG: hypothetical protein A2939_04825 [Parcubacteria group bacterium RIFCSPLOWO2_01_FULL_48_18]|nr:MAG: hypothetical protein A2939_04825 [Parcubacteria group bacterium RIFCSPLOWO2_01_FULL_48_18]OHB24047.1 MAG: hypothetical protein A3J67_04565 [Parcubacteria group bacterium RIFCSPHIGHO2_02_FULL_48_10b]
MKRIGLWLAIIVITAGLGGALITAVKYKSYYSALSEITPRVGVKIDSGTASSASVLLPEQTDQYLTEEQKKALLEKFKQSTLKEENVVFPESKNPQLPKDPTPEQIDEYLKIVKEMAVATDTIVITNCIPEPAVVRAKIGQHITIINTDEIGHTLLTEDPLSSIPPLGSTTVTISFASGTGVYNYDCDRFFSVGTIWAVE